MSMKAQIAQTFAQYLINKGLPGDITVEEPLDKSRLNKLLILVHTKFPEKYSSVVSHLKNLGNKFATYETQTMGMDEISVPNRKKRDEILNRHEALLKREETPDGQAKVMEALQKELAENDLAGGTDSATEMVVSGGLGGKKLQLMKLRTTPGVVTDSKGGIVPAIIKNSYSEGLTVRDNWLQAVQGRKAYQDVQLSTAAPGELSKVMGNILNSAVVSTDDCETQAGILLFTRDDSIVDRYLAKSQGKYSRNTLITTDVQQDLLSAGISQLLVRSPETCQAKGGSVCAKCMGLRVSTGRPYTIGDNAGMISAGILGQDVTQLALSAKHGNAMATGAVKGLTGEKGLRTFVESPKIYPNKQILCEMYGVIYMIRMAPQGGKEVIIRPTKKVPERYIVNADKVDGMKGFYQYYIPPQRKLLDHIKQNEEVTPGMVLTDGNVNMRDVARLRNLGIARSQFTEGMYKVYKDTGVDMDRRHLELLSRNTLNQVKIEKSPKDFPFRRGEVVEYNALQTEITKFGKNSKPVPIDDALGRTLTEAVMYVSAGTELTQPIVDQLKAAGAKEVKVTDKVQTSAIFTPMTRSLNNVTDRWLSKLNHRYIGTALKDAAAFGEKESIHGYSPMASYAYGVEFGHGKDGTY